MDRQERKKNQNKGPFFFCQPDAPPDLLFPPNTQRASSRPRENNNYKNNM